MVAFRRGDEEQGTAKAISRECYSGTSALSRRIRMRPGSTTEKLPAQSSRVAIMLTKRLPKSPGCGMGVRNNMTPQVAGSADIFANSPKSLSKVSKTRASSIARWSTSRSLAPGIAVLTQTTSCPAA